MMLLCFDATAAAVSLMPSEGSILPVTVRTAPMCSYTSRMILDLEALFTTPSNTALSFLLPLMHHMCYRTPAFLPCCSKSPLSAQVHVVLPLSPLYITGLLYPMHLAMQETANQLLERYASHLIKTDQHTLVPLYACLMRIDKRRTLYASYLHDLTMHSLEHCWLAYRLAQDCFDKWRSGDVETGLELDRIVEQVGLLGMASVKEQLLGIHILLKMPLHCCTAAIGK